MRKRLVLVMIGAVAIASAAAAQTDGRRFEFSIGYSHSRAASTFESETVTVPGEGSFTTEYCADEGREAFGPNFQQFFCRDKGMNGLEASATWNVARYLGIKGAVAGHRKSESFVDTFEVGPGETFTANVRTKDQVYMLVAGVQLRDNQSPARLRPFGHVLAGAARQKVRFQLPGVFDARAEETSFAMRIGAGVDWQLTDRIDLRLIEVNYNPIVAGERPLTGDGISVPIEIQGRTANNVTIGFGVVVHR